uniref:Heat shock protein n=1 Tax=Lissorhoptrus oryzophilus TaxID=308863 RepID=A0A0B4L059_9CUCU|nr:heat shock protein [Lissorhoptrus oryzophilus]
MGFLKEMYAKSLAIKKCLKFAEDNCFKNIRDTLSKFEIPWEKALEENQTSKIRFVSAMDHVIFHSDRFEILVDTRGFKPEEIKCNMTPTSVEVTAQTDAKIDNNVQKRMSLSRQYMLPQNAVPENGVCCLSQEGILLITAPWSNK